MRILVTGATGFVGSRLVPFLAETGHEVLGLSRRPDKARGRVPALTDAYAWEPEDGPPPADALRGVSAVVHLAGEPVEGRWTEAKRARILQSRRLGTRHLVQAMAEADPGPKTLVSASAIGWYPDRGAEPLDEGSEPGDHFLAEVCKAWEEEAQAAEGRGVRVVRLRIGLVLDPGGGALGKMLPMAKAGLLGPMGGGRQWQSWIHRDDLLGLVRWAVETDSVHGVLNAVSPGAVPQREFAKTLGRVLGRPAFLPAPAFALKAVLGGFSAEVLMGRNVVPKAALESGYRFRFPELEGALRDLVG